MENGCSTVFDNQLQLEQNMLSKQHNFSVVKSRMDKVKLSFTNRMKKSSNELSPLLVESSSIQQRSSETSSLNQFSEQDWALHV